MPQCMKRTLSSAIAPRTIPSPTWHRSGRKCRSRARRRVRKAKHVGLKPKPADLRRLLDHPSASSSLVASLLKLQGTSRRGRAMGRGEKWEARPGLRNMGDRGICGTGRSPPKRAMDPHGRRVEARQRPPRLCRNFLPSMPARDRAPRVVVDLEDADEALVPGVQKALTMEHGRQKLE